MAGASKWGLQIAVVVVIALGAKAVETTTPLRRLSVATTDALLRVAASQPDSAAAPTPEAAIVAIDPQSLSEAPAWPWPRSRYADAIEALDAAGARAIVFDFDFSSPSEPEEDARFAAALARSGRVVLGVARQEQELPGVGTLEVANRPIPALAEAAAALGHMVLPVEADGVVRRAQRELFVGGEKTASIASAALQVASPSRRAAVERLEVDALVDYRLAGVPIAIVSFSDLVAGRFQRDEIAGRVVFLGGTAAAFQDLWNTPLQPAQPGVWLQALSYRTLALRSSGTPTLRAVAAGWELVTLIALSALAAAWIRGEARRRIAATAGLAAASVGATFVVLFEFALVVSPVPALLVLGARYTWSLEFLSRRFRRQVEAQQQSLASLHEIGELAVGESARGGLVQGLALLAHAVAAASVSLFRAERSGALDPVGIEWGQPGAPRAGDPERAAQVLGGGAAELLEDGAVTRLYLPLQSGGRASGVLAVAREGHFDDASLQMAGTVAAQLALAIDNQRLAEDLQLTFNESIEAMATAVEARDGYTEMHCRRLAWFSTLVAARFGFSEEEIEAIRLGALLHDVGKIGVRDEVLLKPDTFTPDERVQMQQHAEIGHRIVSPIRGLGATTLACVRNHHEWWDGTGYPDRIRGEEIPLAARIVAVVDTWDALSSERPYKPAFPQDEVLRLLEKNRGSQFDPAVLDAFYAVLDEAGEEMVALTAGRRRS